jgi:hypothetical protein
MLLKVCTSITKEEIRHLLIREHRDIKGSSYSRVEKTIFLIMQDSLEAKRKKRNLKKI